MLGIMQSFAQPNGITCGPTCLKMVADFNGAGDGITILMISDMCGTNNKVGTTDVALKKGLDGLGLNYIEYKNSSVNEIQAGFERGSVFILRTLMNGMKHWILTTGIAEREEFIIFDPSMGRYNVKASYLDSICKPRDWQIFEILKEQDSTKFLSLMTLKEGWNEAITLAEKTFSKYVPLKAVAEELASTNRGISPTLWIGNTLIGAYFLSRVGILPNRGLKAVCGKGLIVNPTYRGRGYGSLLRGIPATMDIDYVWGMQIKTLNNLKDWLKRRILIREYVDCYATAEIITQTAYQAFQEYI